MSGFRVVIEGISVEGEGRPSPSDDTLTTGILFEGGASDNMSENAWVDISKGTSYGDGHAYEFKEAPFIAKVRSNNR